MAHGHALLLHFPVCIGHLHAYRRIAYYNSQPGQARRLAAIAGATGLRACLHLQIAARSFAHGRAIRERSCPSLVARTTLLQPYAGHVHSSCSWLHSVGDPVLPRKSSLAFGKGVSLKLGTTVAPTRSISGGYVYLVLSARRTLQHDSAKGWLVRLRSLVVSCTGVGMFSRGEVRSAVSAHSAWRHSPAPCHMCPHSLSCPPARQHFFSTRECMELLRHYCISGTTIPVRHSLFGQDL